MIFGGAGPALSERREAESNGPLGLHIVCAKHCHPEPHGVERAKRARVEGYGFTIWSAENPLSSRLQTLAPRGKRFPQILGLTPTYSGLKIA